MPYTCVNINLSRLDKTIIYDPAIRGMLFHPNKFKKKKKKLKPTLHILLQDITLFIKI
jgi:hypothetical protein